MSVSFKAIVAATAKAAKLPAAKQKAALGALALSPADKLEALAEFCWRRFRQDADVDRLAWTYVAAAIGPRDRLPWTRLDVIHIARMVTPRPDTLPPGIIARMVDELVASGGTLPKQAWTWILQTASALEAFATDAPTRKAVARLRSLAPVTPPKRRGQSSSAKTKRRGQSSSSKTK